MIGGKKRYHEGKRFEQMLEVFCQYQNIAFTRMPDGCKQLDANKLIRVKTPFDYLLSVMGQVAFLDTKSVNEKCFAHGLIKEHQVHEMLMHAQHGVYCGYVIWFRPMDEIYYVPCDELAKAMRVKKNLYPTDNNAVLLGTSLNVDLKKIFYNRI